VPRAALPKKNRNTADKKLFSKMRTNEGNMS